MRAEQRLPAPIRSWRRSSRATSPTWVWTLLGWNGDENAGGRTSVVRNLSLFRAKPNPNAGRSLLRPAPPEDAAANPHTLPSPRKGSARGLAGERKGSGTPRKGSAREVQGTAGLLRQYSEQI